MDPRKKREDLELIINMVLEKNVENEMQNRITNDEVFQRVKEES